MKGDKDSDGKTRKGESSVASKKTDSEVTSSSKGTSSKRPTKWIVITGGVISGLGKGVAAASVGNLLASNYKVVPIKCDGYLNVDPGTMNPIEHGEVFVLDDGGEVDMDFGHYERFLGITCKFEWNLTMGKVFERIRDAERRGDYLGKTVQMIPNVTKLIKSWWRRIAEDENADIILLEIGGTVGDIENELYIEAARQMRHDVGKENITYLHLTYVPIPEHVNEPKTKPTQQSAALLRQRGIISNIILARCHKPLDDKTKKKMAIFCDLPRERIISAVDVDSVYKIPLIFEDQGMQRFLDEDIHTGALKKNDRWRKLVEQHDNPSKEITVAIAGKYTKLEDSYASIIEALHHCEALFETKIKIKWIETSEKNNLEKEMKSVDAVIVPGGFGSRGVEGKISMIKYCRDNDVPFLGLCYGLQMAVIEFARDVCGLKGANSTEVDPKTEYPVIDILPEQKKITKKGGTMRLGAYPAVLKRGTKVCDLYGSEKVFERHRHRYEVNPEYHKVLQDKGLVFSGLSPDGTLVEFIEDPKLRYFVATQAHPELKSSLIDPSPLFRGLIESVLKKMH